jgi:hypothetical protein
MRGSNALISTHPADAAREPYSDGAGDGDCGDGVYGGGHVVNMVMVQMAIEVVIWGRTLSCPPNPPKLIVTV